MSLGLIFHLLFLTIYASFAGAIAWHLEVYSFSRSARWMIFLFAAVAIFMMGMSLVFFFKVDWPELLNLYPNA